MQNVQKAQLIAEVKTASPFGWRSEKTWDELFKIASEHGDMLSIHTDPRWHGSMKWISEAKTERMQFWLARISRRSSNHVGRPYGTYQYTKSFFT